MDIERVKTQGYTLRMTKQRMTARGVQWLGRLYHNGVDIGTAHNEGCGGQTMCNITRDARPAYDAAASIACPDSGEPYARFAELLADVADNMAVAI